MSTLDDEEPERVASIVGLRDSLGDLRDPDWVVPDEIAKRIAATIPPDAS